jgi:hypothetical protein
MSDQIKHPDFGMVKVLKRGYLWIQFLRPDGKKDWIRCDELGQIKHPIYGMVEVLNSYRIWIEFRRPYGTKTGWITHNEVADQKIENVFSRRSVDLVTLDMLLRMLDVPPATVSGWRLLNSSFPVERSGRRTLYKLKALKRWLKRNRPELLDRLP